MPRKPPATIAVARPESFGWMMGGELAHYLATSCRGRYRHRGRLRHAAGTLATPRGRGRAGRPPWTSAGLDAAVLAARGGVAWSSTKTKLDIEALQ